MNRMKSHVRLLKLTPDNFRKAAFDKCFQAVEGFMPFFAAASSIAVVILVVCS